MTTSRHRLNVSFTDPELARVRALAKQSGLSMSELLRRLSLNHDVPDPESFPLVPQIRSLLRSNTEQAALGNRLKQILDEQDSPFPASAIAEISRLLLEIGRIQGTIRQKVDALDLARPPTAKSPHARS